MKRVVAFLFWGTLLLAAPAVAQYTPTEATKACGPAKTTFVVVDENDQDSQMPVEPPPAAGLQPGKALVYFIQDGGPFGNEQHYTLKVGMDGAWVGAYKRNSYFSVAVDPGEHHVCVNVQSSGWAKSSLALAHFTAEAGKVYYYRTKPLFPYPTLDLDQPDSDEAKYLISIYPVSIWHEKK